MYWDRRWDYCVVLVDSASLAGDPCILRRARYLDGTKSRTRIRVSTKHRQDLLILPPSTANFAYVKAAKEILLLLFFGPDTFLNFASMLSANPVGASHFNPIFVSVPSWAI